MLPKPNEKTTLCLDTSCPRREHCYRYVKGGNLTVADFDSHNWMDSCTAFSHYIRLENYML